jgi:glycosyltransferase involved in cell wall biosynthesis
MRVAIDAQIYPGGGWGGIEQFVLGLVSALGQLDDAADEYIIVGHWRKRDWLKPLLAANQQLVGAPVFASEVSKLMLGPFRKSAGRLYRQVRRLSAGTLGIAAEPVPHSNGFYESLGVEVVHFPYQHFVKCNLPTVYSPHDLQHLHYPQFFSHDEYLRREAIVSGGCRAANAIATDSQWVKNDIVSRYGVDVKRVYVIPMAPATERRGEIKLDLLERVKNKFRLPSLFALYPAQTWAHKNHIGLLQALALLRDREGLRVNLVCVGKQTNFWRSIRDQIRALRFGDQVHFLGFVQAEELRALYHLAQFVIFPSLFEGGGLPVLEAFQEGTPVACSAVTSLPEYAGDAALLFDPASVDSLANAIKRMATDEVLRQMLCARGASQVQRFSWQRTAMTYRALYRKVAGQALTDADQALLAECG